MRFWTCVMVCALAAAEAAFGSGDLPGWFTRAPALAPPQGPVIRVGTVGDLRRAADEVTPGGTILLENGDYHLLGPIILQGKKDVTLRSAGGDPDKVILRGKGWNSGDDRDDIIRIGHCDGVTMADLTLTDCHSYGIKVEAENAPRNIHIYNCRFRDIGIRAIKGSAGRDPAVRAVKGSVRYCVFENSKVPPAEWLFGGDYISAIDMMALEDWTFSDNFFRAIKGRNGGARAAIFIWVRSRRVIVERNVILDCDRGVAFGNPGQSTANLAGERLVYISDGIIRNNFIAGGSDCGIELWFAERIKVLNNSIWRPERNWSRGIRVGTGTSQTDLVNNLVHGEIRLEGGEAELRQNLAGRLEGYFVDPGAGDLGLTSRAGKAVDQGVPLPEVTDDIRHRPRTGPPDLGAWEGNRERKAASGTPQAATEYFPPPESEGGWRKLESPDDFRRTGGMNQEKLADLKQWLLNSDDRNFAAVVIRHGHIVLEVERGKSAITDAGRVASVSKAVCATVLAIASEQSQRGLTPRKMKFDDPAFQFIPWARPLSDPRKEKITVQQLLNHTSGICPEALGAPNDGSWEYILGHSGDARTTQLAFDPGTACGYSTHALAHAALVCETVTGRPYDQFAIEALFKPLGIEHWWFQFYDGGEKYGRHPSHGLGMPARDLARIAYCMLHGGRWKDGQVIPEWFVDETASHTHHVKSPEMRWKLNPEIFSHGWELPARLAGAGGRSGSGIPADARAKPGSGGQYIAFVPSLDLVLTRQTGSSGDWPFEEYLRRACAAAVDGKQ